MATTPFGESFGDPRRYMGQSPLAEIGKGLKQGLTAYALKESGFVDYLNKLNPKPVQGAVPPAPTATASPAPVQPPKQGFTPSFVPVVPSATPPAAPQGVVNQVPDNNAPPPDIGEQILNGTWTGSSLFPQQTAPIDVRNPTDFNPLAPDMSNQLAVSGNDYQQVPGYGKLQKALGQLLGMG